MTSTEKVTKLLADLPEDADLIAEFMRDHGYTGTQQDGRHCPMANYFTSEGVGNARVYHDEVKFTSEFYKSYIDFPEHVSQFVENFDDGVYPFLVEE